MKVAFDLRDVPSDSRVDLLHALFEIAPAHQFTLYCTIFNYLHLDTAAANVRRVTLPVGTYDLDLEQRLEFEGDVNLLVRGRPDHELAFPWHRQVLLAESPGVDESLKTSDPEEYRARVLAFRRMLAEAGAVAAMNEAAHAVLASNPWTSREVERIAGRDPGEAARQFLELLERTATAAERAHIRVHTPPTVSIVTPSFNQGRFLRRTIDSVLQQDYPRVQYQVIDGGSTDETVAILKSYGSRLAWVSEADRGQAHAINKGLAKATGEILAYLNSDDTLRPGAVSEVVDHFRKHPACDVAYGKAAYIDSEDRYLGMYATAEFSFKRLAEDCCIGQPAAFWRRRIADEVGPFDESLHLALDYDYWLRIAAAAGRVQTCPSLLAHSRLHRETKSAAATRERWYDEIFRTVLAHAGYVSRTHIERWVAACILPKYPWLRHVRVSLENVLFRWYDHRATSNSGIAKRCAQAIDRRVRHAARMLPGSGRLSAMLRKGRGDRLEGVRSDNWLATECRFPARGGRKREPIVIAGEAPLPMQLHLQQGNDSPPRTIDLPGREPVRITVPGSDGRVVLRFSSHIMSLDGHRVSFRLHGTNLFHERDAA